MLAIEGFTISATTPTRIVDPWGELMGSVGVVAALIGVGLVAICVVYAAIESWSSPPDNVPKNAMQRLVDEGWAESAVLAFFFFAAVGTALVGINQRTIIGWWFPSLDSHARHDFETTLSIWSGILLPLFVIAAFIVPHFMARRRRRRANRLAIAHDLCERAAFDAGTRGEMELHQRLLHAAADVSINGVLPGPEIDRRDVAHRAYRDAQQDEDYKALPRLHEQMTAIHDGKVLFSRNPSKS